MSTVRRLFFEGQLTKPGDRIRLNELESHHGRDVLRLRPGGQVLVFDDSGNQFEATVDSADSRELVVVLGNPAPPAPESAIPLALYVALAKGAAFESVIQRAIELGVTEIQPFTSERSVVRIKDGTSVERKITRWRQIVLGATKQCGRARIADIAAPIPFPKAVRQKPERCAGFCCAATPGAPKLSAAIESIARAAAESVSVMIGPEGGLSPEEIALAEQAGWQIVSLGSRTLRVETAASAALAATLAHFREI